MFWEDRWLNGQPIVEIAPCIPKRRRKGKTITDGLQDHNWARDIQSTIGIHEIGQYLTVWRLTERCGLELGQMASGSFCQPPGTFTEFQFQNL
jgi:hypothetical protein